MFFSLLLKLKLKLTTEAKFLKCLNTSCGARNIPE